MLSSGPMENTNGYYNLLIHTDLSKLLSVYWHFQRRPYQNVWMDRLKWVLVVCISPGHILDDAANILRLYYVHIYNEYRISFILSAHAHQSEYFANKVTKNGTAPNICLIRTYTICRSAFSFWQASHLTTMYGYVSKYKEGRVQFGTLGWKNCCAFDIFQKVVFFFFIIIIILLGALHRRSKFANFVNLLNINNSNSYRKVKKKYFFR